MYIYTHIWAISKTLGSRKGHPQIWEGPIAYHTFVQWWYMVNLGGIACRKLLHLYIYIYNSQKSTSNLGIANVDIREIQWHKPWKGVSLIWEGPIAYRVFLTISINFHKPMSVQYIFSIAMYCRGFCGGSYICVCTTPSSTKSKDSAIESMRHCGLFHRAPGRFQKRRSGAWNRVGKGPKQLRCAKGMEIVGE